MHQPTLTALVKKYTSCQGVVWSQYRLSGTFNLCSNNFWCGFVCQGVFFLTNAVTFLDNVLQAGISKAEIFHSRACSDILPGKNSWDLPGSRHKYLGIMTPKTKGRKKRISSWNWSCRLAWWLLQPERCSFKLNLLFAIIKVCTKKWVKMWSWGAYSEKLCIQSWHNVHR